MEDGNIVSAPYQPVSVFIDASGSTQRGPEEAVLKKGYVHTDRLHIEEP